MTLYHFFASSETFLISNWEYNLIAYCSITEKSIGCFIKLRKCVIMINWGDENDLRYAFTFGFFMRLQDTAPRKRGERRVAKHKNNSFYRALRLLPGRPSDRGSYFKGKDKRESYTVLLREALECLKKYTFVDTLGHIDYSSRYAPYEDRQLRYREFPDEFDELFRYIIENGLSLEFNTKTAGRVPPDPDVWTRYKELGGELVTFASDAHKPWLVGYEFEKHTAFLKNLGYKYAFRYENRKPVAEEL